MAFPSGDETGNDLPGPAGETTTLLGVGGGDRDESIGSGDWPEGVARLMPDAFVLWWSDARIGAPQLAGRRVLWRS